MKFALHGMVTMYSNIISDIRLAKEAAYDGLELHTEKLWRYLRAGGSAEKFVLELQKHKIMPAAIDIIGNVEAATRSQKAAVLSEAEELIMFAKQIGAPTIQLNAFEGLNALSEKDNIKIVAQNIIELARLGAQHGIRFQYEGAAWTPIHSLSACLDLVDAVGEPNFGLVIDFWHFWASRGACPDDIAKLDASIIYAVHCCTGTRPQQQADVSIRWLDEKLLRGYFPGDEIVNRLETGVSAQLLPVQEWVDAIKSTGYEGWVSGEFLHEGLWEQDNLYNAKLMKQRLDSFFKS